MEIILTKKKKKNNENSAVRHWNDDRLEKLSE